MFHSLAVFCFITKAELAGERQKAWVCRVVEHEKPTTENWKDYFVGFSSLKEYAWQALEPGQKIDILSTPVLAGNEEIPMLSSGDELSVQSAAVPVAVERRDVVHTDVKEGRDPDIPF